MLFLSNFQRPLGREVAGWIEETGNSVPSHLFQPWDLVPIFGGWDAEHIFIARVKMNRCVSLESGHDCLHLIVIVDILNLYFILVPSYQFLVKVDKNSCKSGEFLSFCRCRFNTLQGNKENKVLFGSEKSIAIFGIGNWDPMVFSMQRFLEMVPGNIFGQIR